MGETPSPVLRWTCEEPWQKLGVGWRSVLTIHTRLLSESGRSQKEERQVAPGRSEEQVPSSAVPALVA